MSSKEILTLQFGHYANFIGTHWWNIQELGFDYHSTQPSEIDHEVLFREGLNPKGQITFTPRLLLVDLKGSLKTLPEEGDLYGTNSAPSPSSVNWDENKVEFQEKQCEPKNDFQKDLNNANIEAIVVQNKQYNLEKNVQVWSDYLYSRFHPRTVNIVNEFKHCNEENPFESYTLGTSLWKSDFFNDEFTDKIRNYIEECDQLQGFHVLTDCTNGFSGLSSACLEHVRDEFDRKSVLVLPVIPSYFPDNDFKTPAEQVHSIMSDSARVINMLLSFNSYREHSNLFVPLCVSQDGWRQPGIPKQFYHTEYQYKLPYHSSAILAAALETITLKYRLKNSHFNLPDICADLSAHGRQIAAGSLCFPFSFNEDASFIDCLDQWEGPLYTSITPRVSIGNKRLMQHLVLRGVPESRLKRAGDKAGKQKDMAAYKCNTIREMLEFYLSCSTYATASNVTTMEKGVTVKNPFPDLFDKSIGINGNVTATQRLENTGVESIPVLAGVHSGNEIGEMIESLYDEARKLKIARFHQFAVERDEYEESLNDLLFLRDNYEDTYLV
ncbi:hypothetical protein ABEB36_002599 [Hypothenemus hampei]|uniref:Protein misato n=1 Tax=Hypothenemus hampei TaxID=57062 RepID=A0ABD1F6B9_HYPHA